jgi:hypothetical protein
MGLVVAQTERDRAVTKSMAHGFSSMEAAFHFRIQCGFMIPVICKGGVDLAEAQLRVLVSDLFRSPVVSLISFGEFYTF